MFRGSMRIRVALWTCLAVCTNLSLANAPGAGVSAQFSPGVKFQECPDCPTMIVVPAGHFTMTRKSARDGRRDDDPEGASKRQPAREIDIENTFAMGIYPVTRQQFSVFVRETRQTPDEGCYVQQRGVWVFDASKDWSHPGFTQAENHPVTCVSWSDAEAYIQWLNTKRRDFTQGSLTQASPDQGAYRLPTWEEIEYAARAGTTSLYYWGDQPRRDQANYGADSCLPCRSRIEGADRWAYTSPVGSFPPNAFGLYDMAGNVWQWAQRCQPDPLTIVSKDCRTQVLHGGSWLTSPDNLRTGANSSADMRHRNYEIGFRVLRTVGAVPTTAAAKFRDCAHDCPEMVVIPAGSFIMGSGPTHRVTFAKPFALGVYDVTLDEYSTFVRATSRASGKGCNVVDSEGRWITDPSKDWRYPGFEQTGRDPVVCVSWEDAQAYIAWLNHEVHSGEPTEALYRLPSEAEWEYAARAGTATSYYWGDVASHDLANYGIEHCYPCGAARQGRDRWYFTSPVGAFPPNAFGLYDISGNVWQWTADCTHYSFTGAPDDGSAWTTDDNDACHNRILRGGSWLDPAILLSIFVRNPWAPDDRNYANGFRVARTLN